MDMSLGALACEHVDNSFIRDIMEVHKRHNGGS